MNKLTYALKAFAFKSHGKKLINLVRILKNLDSWLKNLKLQPNQMEEKELQMSLNLQSLTLKH